MTLAQPTASNHLYPVFLKLEQLQVLLVGGGNVAFEKLQSLLTNSPATKIKVVAPSILPAIESFIVDYPHCTLYYRPFEIADLDQQQLVILATDDRGLHEEIKHQANAKGLLVNVADTPQLCDFYLGSIVQHGYLKIAISTDGKSPTIAKRLKQVIAESLPPETDDLLVNMRQLRDRMSGDFAHKVKKLNEITGILVSESTNTVPVNKPSDFKTKTLAQTNKYLIIIGLVLFIVSAIYSVYFFGYGPDVLEFISRENHLFLWMVLVGFLAEIVAGSMGMGYGVICTTTLLLLNIPPPVVSASIHSAESFTSAAGSISHYKLGNVNKKLFKRLVVPAIIGAILGALALSFFGEHYAKYTKPIIAVYTLYLGIKILQNAMQQKATIKRTKTNITRLGLIGGFIDSFGGGGWGPLVTGTFIKNGRTPRFVVGSSTMAKFVLTVASAITFLFTLGIQHWNIVVGLLLGGVVTAPFSAMLTSKLPTRKMFWVVGCLVIFVSLFSLVKALFL